MEAATVFEAARSRQAHAYVLVDPAQDNTLPAALCFESAPAACLLDGGPDVVAVAPHLIPVDATCHDRAAAWLDRHAAHVPCATLLISVLPLDALVRHLSAFVDVVLPDRTVMALAFWDPSILAVLNGARGDDTLHVPGPVLTPGQKQAFLAPILEWWYWDRAGRLRPIDWYDHAAAPAAPTILPPLNLGQHQVDALVEASVPDSILYYIRLNLPGLLLRTPEAAQYPFVRAQLRNARQYGLEGTGDLVNYCCVALAYRAAFDSQPEVTALLARVKEGALSFDELMRHFPDDIPTLDAAIDDSTTELTK